MQSTMQEILHRQHRIVMAPIKFTKQTVFFKLIRLPLS